MVENLFVDNEYARNKLENAKNTLRETYYKSSDLEKLVAVEDAGPHEEDFIQLYFRHLIPKDWFTREDFIIDYAFRQLGDNLARSEGKYILDRILEEPNIRRVNLEENVLDGFIDNFREFSRTKSITALFIPIDFYTNVYTDWPQKKSELQIDYSTTAITICDIKPNIFWSNKFRPFHDFVLLDKRFGKWTSKPSFNDRLIIEISNSEKEDQLDLLFLTKMKFQIVDPEKILILHRPFMENQGAA
jgi:hypothetical protein